MGVYMHDKKHETALNQSSLATMAYSPRSGKKVLLLMLLIFALPVIAAKLILSMNWYQSGVTNHGVLIDSQLHYQDLGLTNPARHTWQMAYLLPQDCAEICQQQLHLLKQSHIALGKDQPRVMPVVIAANEKDLTRLQDSGFVLLAAPELWGQLEMKSFAGQDFVLIDPLGQWVMRYPTAINQDELSDELKGLLADLRKLLKLSRVG
ncbi:hypothetical protein GCM10007931_04290 [Vibrio algivorus]|uniref:Cytochrome oxidase assembly protein n=3 Tax=Vibrio algivorus TaxID=1667024 RepID=A0ABQ6ELH3_9VIBR|nr:hypothetical protein GCM10007931_04290 [Vibrio algivorus]